MWGDNGAGGGLGFAKTFTEVNEHYIGCSSFVVDPETFCDRGMKLVIFVADPNACAVAVTLYVDNKAVGGACAPAAGIPTGDDFGGAAMTLGCSDDPDENCLHGEIGNVRLYNEVLSVANLEAIATPMPTFATVTDAPTTTEDEEDDQTVLFAVVAVLCVGVVVFAGYCTHHRQKLAKKHLQGVVPMGATEMHGVNLNVDKPKPKKKRKGTRRLGDK